MSDIFGDDIITITDEDGVEYVLEVFRLRGKLHLLNELAMYCKEEAISKQIVDHIKADNAVAKEQVNGFKECEVI